MYGSVYYNQDSKDTVPASIAVTGTIETVGTKVIGTTTKFKTEYQIGDFVYVAAKSDVRRVVNIISDTQMTLETAFGSDVAAGGTPKKVARQTCRVMKIWNGGGASATLDGQTLLNGTGVEFSKVGAFGSSTANTDFVDPVVLDAAASDCQINLVK